MGWLRGRQAEDQVLGKLELRPWQFPSSALVAAAGMGSTQQALGLPSVVMLLGSIVGPPINPNSHLLLLLELRSYLKFSPGAQSDKHLT